VCLGLQLRAQLQVQQLCVATWRRVWWLGSGVWGRTSRRRQVCRGDTVETEGEGEGEGESEGECEGEGALCYVMLCYGHVQYGGGSLGQRAGAAGYE
jgi:hypothetical protein